MYEFTLIMIYLVPSVVTIVMACVFGTITKRMNEEKGYYGGFAWGFWLGVIGIIVVACRQPAPSYRNISDEKLRSLANQEDEQRILRNGGWKCYFCNRVNPEYMTSCTCGRTAKESKDAFNDGNHNSVPKKSVQGAELDIVKKMFEDGLITEQEYEAKKQKITEKYDFTKPTKSPKSVTEIQLENLKKLLDNGTITQEEYELKRKITLGI